MWRSLQRMVVLSLVSILTQRRSAAGQPGREGVVQCATGLKPVYGHPLSGWLQPQQQCWTIEEDLPQWNSSQLESDDFDAGNYLRFNSGNAGGCYLRSSLLHLVHQKSTCHLKFDVRMWGSPARNSLELHLLTNPIVSATDRTDVAVWSKASSAQRQDGSTWGSVELSFTSSDLQLAELQFVAAVGSPGASGVALDNVAWTDCCLTECISDIGFDSGWDGWFNEPPKPTDAAVLKWQRWSGSTPSLQTGPSGDVSTVDRTGHYLYVDSSSGKPGERASLLSPVLVLKSTAVSCRVSFSFHMYGQDTGYLVAGVRSSNDWNTTTVLRNISDSVRGWRQSGNLVIPQNGAQFRLEFTGVRGNGFRGDIAIDRITLDEWCACPLQQDVSAQGFTIESAATTSPPASSSSQSDAGYIAAVVILCILSAALVMYILGRQFIWKKSSPAPEMRDEAENPVFIATQKRLSLLGLPLNDNTEQRQMTRTASSASWQLKSPPAGEETDQATTGGTEHIEITPSLLDLMEMESSEGGLLE